MFKNLLLNLPFFIFCKKKFFGNLVFLTDSVTDLADRYTLSGRYTLCAHCIPEYPGELPDGPNPALCGVYLRILASSLMALTLRSVLPDGSDPALCGVYLRILACSLMALTLRSLVYT